MTPAERIQLKRNDEDLKHDISAGLIALRATKGWTRRELAALLPNVTVGDLQSWEHQARAPTQLKLLQISRLLGLDLSRYPAEAVRLASIQHAQRRAREAPTPVIDVAALVTTQRLQSGLTIKAFAGSWGVAPQTLRNWESGTLPTGNNVTLVAERLSLPATAIGAI